mmetsp:Transcript_2537/g.2994  ORF Transcript_2537/g.2994 Transcript_2537/m.2994 type:complete len:243 (-) Transcript_2537:64-792(-)
MFIISLAISDELDNDYFLGVPTHTLCRLGAKDADLIQNGEVHRFILPVILHLGFVHLVQNSVFLLIIGSMFEVIVQPLRFIAVYLVAGIGGNLLSSLASDSLAAGASTSLSGLTGGLVSFLIVNWIAMESTKQIRCCLTCFIVVIALMTVVLALIDISTSASNVDNWGHLGGFFTGLLFAMSIMPILKTAKRRDSMPGMTFEKYCKIFGGAATILWLGIGITMLFTERDPQSICSRFKSVIQ